MKKLFLTAAVSAGLLLSVTTYAQDSSATIEQADAAVEIVNPQAYVQGLADKVLHILTASGKTEESDPAAVTQSIEQALVDDIALSQMSEYLIGPLWTAASEAEQAAYIRALLDFIGNLYKTALNDFSSMTKVVVYATRDDYKIAQRVQVNSIINSGPGSNGIPVSYVLIKQNDDAGNFKKWLVYDFNIDNSLSLLGNLQLQFRSMINGGNNTIEGLTDTLNTHNQMNNK